MAKNKELEAMNEDTAMKQQQMNDPTQGVTLDNLQMLKQMKDMEVAEKMRDQSISHDPDHAQYGISSGQPMQIIGKEEIHKANEILMKYKEGKSNLERRIIDNEQWWKLRHWEQIATHEENMDAKEIRRLGKATSAWLHNSLVNKHADIMDNYPEATILPRARDDEETAKVLSSVLPVIFEQNKFEQVYNDVAWYKLKSGTGAYGVFWDSKKNNGLGDVDIRKVDLLQMYWESGITDLQDSENLFYVTLVSNKKLKAAYPDIDLIASNNPTIDVAKYIYDDTVDTTECSAVVDWYYKVDVPAETNLGTQATKTLVHYVKYCNGEVLYASENDPQYQDKGYYSHGQYPFVLDVLFKEEGTPCGFGYIDIMKSPQEYIDRLSDAILENAIAGSKPRFFVRDDGDINEEEFADTRNAFIHTTGNLGDESIRPITPTGLSSIYLSVLNNKIEELKETSGNRDVNQGSTPAGVTSGTAVAALQEASSKGSRDINRATFRAYTEICYLVIELMRQFYDEPRTFRIIGNRGQNQFTSFDNSGMLPQSNGEAFGVDLGSRLPIFDIKVVPAKQTAYSKMSENELALQFYNLGFFAPNNADQSLACLDMMEFDGKEKIVDKISQNQTMFQTIQALQQQMMQLAAVVDRDHGTNIAAQMMGMAGATNEQMSGITANKKASGSVNANTGSQADKARNEAANVASPN